MERETKRTKSISGRGTIRSLASGLKIVSEDGSVYEYGYEDVKDIAIPPRGKEWKNVSFRCSEDGSKLYSISPLNGSHIVKFSKFVAAKDEPPTYRTDEGGERTYERNGKVQRFFAPPKLYFLSLLEIADGEYKGCQVVYSTDYLFKPGSGGMTKIFGGPKPKQRLESFMMAAGFDFGTDDIKYSDNVLPVLESILQSRDEMFIANFEDGKIVSVSDIPSGLKPKKTKKKAE